MTSLVQAWAALDVGRYKSEFYRQWHVGVHAGLPHHRVLETMDVYERSREVRDLRAWLLAGTQRRVSLVQLTAQRPALFEPFEAALLRLGEEAGALEHCLRLLGDHFAAEHRLMLWVKKKLAYPMMNALAACFIAPLPTLVFGSTAVYLATAFGGVAALLLAGGGLLRGAAAWFRRRPTLVLARLLRALTTAVEAGLPLGRAVDLAVEATGDRALAAHVKAQGRRVSQQPLGRTFEGCALIPASVVAALHVAEATGDYGETLGRLADLYDPGGAAGRGAPLAFPA